MEENTYQSYANWELRKKLGSGAFGDVFLWINRKTNQPIATKSLKGNKDLGLDEERKLKKRWQQEYELSRHLSTEYIVKGIELQDKNFIKYLNDNHAWHPLPVLVMEYCNCGDLRAQLKKLDNLNGLTEFEIRKVLRTLCGAIDYMHNQHNVQHRDLKPDNIVIHEKPDGERIYKLTDFGFARNINESTMIMSVVGTRNYFAPEIIDTSGYTKAVDYWSIGIIAFEMLCGCLPFIPHQSLLNQIRSIKSKSSDCIAITEKFDCGEPNQFDCHNRIFDENRVTGVFRRKIESWLRLALDKNFRTRGCGPMEIPNAPGGGGGGGRILKFYTAMDEILTSRIVTIFNVTSNTFHDLEVKSDTKLMDLVCEIAAATGIPLGRIYSFLPVGHPLGKTSKIKQAMDFFVENWTDTSPSSSNPSVMLYLVDINMKESSSKYTDPIISSLIRHCLRIGERELPLWLFQKYAFDIHYLISNEQHNLKTMMNGLREYAMTVEEDIMDYRPFVENLARDANVTKGRVLQYKGMLSEVVKLKTKKLSSNCLSAWESRIRTFEERVSATTNIIIPSLLHRNSSAKRRMQEESNNPIYDEIIKKDLYELVNFRSHLQAKHQGYKFEDLPKPISGCKYCHRAVYSFIEKRSKVYENNQKRLVMLSEIHSEHSIIVDATNKTSKMIEEINVELEKDTSMFFSELLSNAERSNGLVFDGIKASDTSISSNGSLYSSLNEIMETSTKDLIREAADNMELMSIDEHNWDGNIIPETVNFV